MDQRIIITAFIVSMFCTVSGFAQNSFPSVGNASISDGAGNEVIISPGHIILRDNGEQTAVISNDGNAVFSGSVIANEIEVKQDVWSDHVFSDEYELQSLNELNEFIKNNRHLPDVPSENEVIKNGVNMGDMNALLLQKIEELTLYIIELNDRIEKLEGN